MPTKKLTPKKPAAKPTKKITKPAKPAKTAAKKPTPKQTVAVAAPTPWNASEVQNILSGIIATLDEVLAKVNVLVANAPDSVEAAKVAAEFDDTLKAVTEDDALPAVMEIVPEAPQLDVTNTRVEEIRDRLMEVGFPAQIAEAAVVEAAAAPVETEEAVASVAPVDSAPVTGPLAVF